MTDQNEIDDLLRKLEPLLGGTAKSLWYLDLFAKDTKEASDTRSIIRLLADSEIGIDFQESIRLPPPLSVKLSGEYNLGTAIYPESDFSQFGLREQEFIKHILVAGITGSGKTNLVFHLLRQFHKHNKPFLVFDWKRSYRHLRQLAEFKNLRVIQVGNPKTEFHFNPLIPPPSVHPKHWMAMLIDVMKHSFFVSYGPEYFFRKGLDHLYEQFGIYQGKTDYPTFDDLQKLLRKEFVRGREILWMSSARRVLAALTFPGLLGDVLNVRKQHGLAELLSGPVIFELDNLATIEKVFFVESLLLWIYHFRKGEGKRETFKHAIIIEEAHHILSGRKESALGEETIVESLIRMIREFGESVIVIDQEPSKLSHSILANTNCKICFNLGNGWDIQAMSASMALTAEQHRYLDQLQVGHAIIKIKDRFVQPILVRFPLVPVNKGLS